MTAPRPPLARAIDYAVGTLALIALLAIPYCAMVAIPDQPSYSTAIACRESACTGSEAGQ